MWNSTCDKVFQELKTKFCTAPILKHIDPGLATNLKTDSSNYVFSGILSQHYFNPEFSKLALHRVAYLSKKITSEECNYGIGDKELLAIVPCLEKWNMYLHEIEFTIFTDHHNLQNFATKDLFYRRQARWAGLLAQYHLYIQFYPGKANGKADALTHRSRDLPWEEDGRGRPIQTLLN